MSYGRVATAVLAAGVAVAAGSLGRWQLRRLHDRRARNAVFIAAAARAPLDLTREWHAGAVIDSGRRIVARGQFDATTQVILRGRVQDGAPGLHVVTPFVVDGNHSVLWVLRGFVPSPDAATPPDSIASPQAGDVTISGTAFEVPVTPDSGQPLRRGEATTWKRLDRAVLANLRPGSLPAYLLLAGNATGPGRLMTVPPPPISDGPHLSYAIQWFGIALAALAFGVIALWRGGRVLLPRRAAP